MRGAQVLPHTASENLHGKKIRFVFLLPMLLCCAIGLGFIASWLWQYSPNTAMDRIVALQNVRIQGPFLAVTEQQLEEILLPHLDCGFFALNINAIQSTLLQSPWISAAQVNRRWPSEIEIIVEEARPMAMWGKDQVLVSSGKLLPLPPQMTISGLPVLEGNADLTEQIMLQYTTLANLFTSRDMEVQRLSFDESAGWQLELASGLKLRLGHDELLERMHRFLNLAQGVLAPHLQKVVRVDTRYSNAVAVQWKDETKKAIN